MKKLFVLFVFLTLFLVALPALAGTVNADRPAAPGWHVMYPTTIPPARNDHAMAYDRARGEAVLFGGTDGYTHFTDTWVWQSSSMEWVQRFPAHVPPERYGHAMVYDETRGMVVLFGGVGYGVANWRNDTWLWTGDDWQEVVTADAPDPRWLHALAYDPDRQVIVLHSGQQSTTAGPFGDTWEFDQSGNWVEQDITNPTPFRSGAGMAYDRRRQRMVLFGGGNGSFGYNDTWERIGSGDWVQVFTAQSPAERRRGGMVYYERVGRSFIFGGLSTSGYYGDTAAYNGQTWQGKYFTPSPSARCCLGMVYDTTRRAVFLFGGGGGVEHNDNWYFR